METEKKKKNKLVPIIIAILVVVGVVFGLMQWSYYSKHVDTDDAQIDGDISPVVARVGGYVNDINFEENKHVNNGDTLVTLDDQDYKIKLEQAEAGQKGASAGVGVSQAQIVAISANTSTAKANVDAAKIKLDLAEKDFQRYSNLVEQGAITKQAFDQAKATKESADAVYRGAKDQYNAAVKQVGATTSQLAVSNNAITVQQSNIDFAKLQLSYTNIVAPVSGLVSKKNIQKGQLVQAGQSLFSIVIDSSLYVTANFKETQLEDIKPGLKVEVTVDAFPDEKIQGEVLNFAPITGAKGSLLPPDNATGNYVKVVQRVPVKIKIHPSKELLARLRPGMSVQASVIKQK